MKTKKKSSPKLPIEFKRKWVKALKSGKYNQCIRKLYDGNSYCCLGVACVINGINKRLLNAVGQPPFKFSSLPAIIREDSEGKSNAVMNRLMEMNDGENKTFPEIADYIQKNL